MSDDSASRFRAPARVPPAETPGLGRLLALAVGVVVVAALYLGREVLIPVTLAILLSFVLAPLVGLLRRLRLGRVPAVLLAVVVALCVILSLGTLIGMQVADLAREMPRYQVTIEQKVGAVRDVTIGRLTEIIRGVGRQVERASGGPTETTPASPSARTPFQQGRAPLPVEVHEPASSPLQVAERVLSPVLGPLSTTAIVFIFAVFILLQREDLRDRLIRLFGSRDLHRTTAAMDEAAGRLSRYFLFQLAINASFGVIVGFGLFLIGVPSPALWGILGALLRFVPYVGSLLSAALPLAIAAAVDPGWSMMLWTAALYLVVEPLIGHVIEPVVYGRSTGLSPFAVVVAATFWTWLWGPIGLLLATPLTLLLVVLGRYVEHMEFLDVLLGDRPALTPVENFYQRMLADDPDEALDQAELLLRERSLASYYDEVALKGLHLAVGDAQRGVLGPAQMDRVREAVRSLVDDLEGHDDSDPRPEAPIADPMPPSAAERALPSSPALDVSLPEREALPSAWQGEGAVLCIAGRGPLDEAAAAMLAQLLRKHGLGARVLPHDAVSRARVGSLDISDAAMICFTYLDIAGTPSHLRYLLRRLQARLPGAPTLVGFWPAEAAVLRDEQLRAALGASTYTTTLRDTVQACLEAARKATKAEQPAPAEAGHMDTPQAVPAPG
ncbi:AI-2E family transporter [Rhodovastum atsumiense]|uniref:AI-2E family transporter n=1 Tax=Rhodovastum atsumiense TaxID=504468 RepID=A0A5M6IUI3_9PROT|nr:AI-2E family transporter [Rhodovastum atsumiense]KAA5611922.1 AI-2E family transporter [Rhodovastum atsumiense]